MPGWFQPPEPPPGSRPGTLVVTPDAPAPRITLLTYDPANTREQRIAEPEDLAACLTEPGVHWIDVQGLGDPALLTRLGEVFELHALTLEDILNTPQRPKAEWLAGRAFVILRAPYVDSDGDVEVEQISLILGENYVLSFQERYSPRFQPVWDRIMRKLGVVRTQGADYLLYALADAAIDSYYPVLETLGDRLEELETEAMENPTAATLLDTNRVRNCLADVRRGIWPQREAVQVLVRNDANLFQEGTTVYLRDAYEHCLQVSEIVESYRDLVGSVNNTYLSSVSNRTNEVMRVLTIMASLFIPLTFIAGIYGMNFEFMPELGFRWGYPLVWVLMLTCAAGMLIYFRRRGWLGGDD